MSWNIKTPGDFINGPLTVAGQQTLNNLLAIRGTPTFPTSGVGLELFYSSTNSNSNIYSYNRTVSGWAELVLGSSNTIFQINGVNSAFLTTNGLGVGALPAYPLYVFKNQSAITFVGVENQQNNAAGGAGVKLAAYGGTWDVSALHSATYVNPLVFRFNDVEKGRLTTAGAFILNGGATGANGVGITFPAAQSASTDANTLDDYEEGTWTPTLVGVDVTGTGTYSIQNGRYTKVGNLVTVQMYITWSAHTGSGPMRLAGLPFQASSETNAYSAVSVGYFHNISMSAGNVFNGYVINASQVIAFEQYPTGGGQSTPIPVDTAGAFILTASYRV